MPTRAEVIASKIQQYDAQITNEQNADIDNAIAKLATAQLASGAIGGGGGGGGGGDASAANQIAGNNSLSSINTKLPALGQSTPAASTPVVLPAVQITALTPPTNTGYSTSALQTTGNTVLTSIEAKTPSLGQALEAESTPVVLPATQITALTPPSNTGYSTSALQTTGNTSLDSINTKLPVKGQVGMAASTPVVIASDQSDLPANLTQIAGTAVATGAGAVTLGTLRVTLAAATSVTTNFTLINGIVPAVGTGVSGTGTQRVTVAQDSRCVTWDGSNIPAVKAANLSALPTDNSWVVNLSPNSTVFSSLTPNAVATKAMIGGAIYQATPPTLTTGQQYPLRATPNGTLYVTEVSNVSTRTGAAVLSAQSEFGLPAGSRIKAIYLTNNSASVIYLQIHNTAVALAGGEVPVVPSIRVAANSSLMMTQSDFGSCGTLFGATPRVAVSSTFNIYTAISVGNLPSIGLTADTVTL